MLRRLLCLLACCMLVPAMALAKEDQDELRKSLDKAREAQDIRGTGLPAFQLSGVIKIWVSKGKDIDGLYTYSWLGDGKWKEELVFPGYRRVRVGDGKNYWQVRTTAEETLPILQLNDLLSKDPIPGIEAGEELKKARGQKIGGRKTDCVRRRMKGQGTWDYCFARDSGNLLRIVAGEGHSPVEWRIERREYSDYANWQGKFYPRTVQGYDAKNLSMEVRFGEIKPLPSVPANFLEKPKEATAWLECPTERAWRLDKRVQPIYPSEARAAKVQGTVQLYAVIEQDGHVSEMALANNADKSLVSAAATAVRNWIYRRTDACPSAEGKSEAMILVNFSIQY